MAKEEEEEGENRVKASKADHKNTEKEDRCEKDTRKRDTQRRGKVANWTQARNSCPLDWVSGAIKTADMHTEGGGLGAVMAEQEARSASLNMDVMIAAVGG